MNNLEYLLSYGLFGDFGRFRAVQPLSCRRGDHVVAHSARGLEIAEVLREASPGHALFLPNTTVGRLLRFTTPDDEASFARMRERGRRLLERAQELARSLELPLEILDVEVLLDGENGVLHLLRGADCDVRPLVSTLSREFALRLELLDLGQVSAPVADEEDHHGCGKEGCGSGACGACGSGGGCSTCSSPQPKDVQGYFAELREKMEHRHALL